MPGIRGPNDMSECSIARPAAGDGEQQLLASHERAHQVL